MESFEFLGGRYTQPEQIMSGPVQAFRAQNASTGRVVFIHRVSTTEAPAEQAALLKLMTTALVKSAEAKRLVLDFGDESGYWYVVTESEPQCALLREWLQLEIESAGANSRPMAPPVPPPVPKAPAPPLPVAPPAVPSDSDTGEFTRFLKARPASSSPPSSARFTPPPPPPPVPPAQGAPKPEAPPGEFTRVFQSPHAAPLPPQPAATPADTPAAQAPPVQRPPAGEFTSFFNAAPSEAQPPKQFSSGSPQRAPIAEQPADLPPPPGPSKPESGEFTRFFKPGLPSSPPKPPAPTPPNPNLERTQITPRVQRPNTPVPPPPPPAKPLEPGEFTQLFSHSPAPASVPSPAHYQPPTPVRSDPLGFAKQPPMSPNDPSDDLFSDKIDIPKPMPSSQPQQSEFTRMFGNAGSASTPVQPQAVFAPPREKPLVDEPRHTQPLNTQPRPPSDAPPASGPSEFTMIMQGGYGPSKPAPAPATPPAGAAQGQGLPSLPLPNLKVPPLAPPRPPAPNIQLPKPNIPVPPPVNLSGAGGGNKKMIVLFSVLGVLAVLLVVLAVFLMKNK